MDWNCAFTEERLSDYLDGKLSPAEAAALSAHSAGCTRWRWLGSRLILWQEFWTLHWDRAHRKQAGRDGSIGFRCCGSRDSQWDWRRWRRCWW